MHQHQNYWQIYFPTYRHGHSRLIADIGAGWGEWIIERAQNRKPNEFFLANEILLHRAHVMLRQGRKLQADYFKIIRGSTQEWLTITPPASFEEMTSFYPEPWPKRRHSKHRIIAPDFFSLILSRLAPNGTWKLVTDMESFHELSLKKIEACNKRFGTIFEFTFQHNPNPQITRTAYEKRCQNRGFTCHELKVTKKPSSVWSYLTPLRLATFFAESEISQHTLTVGQRL